MGKSRKHREKDLKGSKDVQLDSHHSSSQLGVYFPIQSKDTTRQAWTSVHQSNNFDSSRFLKFLEYDNSFLTPWNRDPTIGSVTNPIANQPKKDLTIGSVTNPTPHQPKKYMVINQGSYFTYG
ncbi:hypothetical protein LIER_04805 [Lithospermum erythrorhizon]|uniref:Uncharacterized protein n=1 Tax=Lithospermum erythrorhizon TaxID=34254 RepID=A0AAV3NZA4_LITER